jgi:hypothetical protein
VVSGFASENGVCRESQESAAISTSKFKSTAKKLSEREREIWNELAKLHGG